jgi:nucleoside-diphosphate-sugar epimerase
VVDVRDVADALVLVYETPEASVHRRFICSACPMKVSEVLAVIKSLRPDLKLQYPTKK